MNMEGQTGVWLLAALLVAALMSAEAQNTSPFFEVGGKLVLTPKQFSGPITGISWKFNGDLVGEWTTGTEVDYYRKFVGRTSVDTTTGVLEISNINEADSGLYTVDINGNEQVGGYDAKVIKQVPDPVAIMRPLTCSEKSEKCVLSCDGDIKGAEPVSFYVKKGDGQWEKREQDMDIKNDQDAQAVPSFSCRMENPLGQKDSGPVKNPFYLKSNIGLIVGVVIVVIIALAVVGGVLFYFMWWKPNKSRNVTLAASPPQSNGSPQEDTPLQETNHGSSDPNEAEKGS